MYAEVAEHYGKTKSVRETAKREKAHANFAVNLLLWVIYEVNVITDV